MNPVVRILPKGPSLNSAATGLELAEQASGTLRAGGVVQIDLQDIERMTASFANALVMTLLDAFGVAEFERRVLPINATPFVLESWSAAVDRYRRGIRLTTQRPGAA